jgi:hypothetical protein|tara:strand:+ start:89 stop:202 length:114 start_codon:yes stop_codon:yes gene_type:complete
VLHACHLELENPATDERLDFNVPLPDDMAELVRELEE